MNGLVNDWGFEGGGMNFWDQKKFFLVKSLLNENFPKNLFVGEDVKMKLRRFPAELRVSWSFLSAKSSEFYDFFKSKAQILQFHETIECTFF